MGNISIDKTIKNLEKNNFKVTYFETAKEILPYLSSVMRERATVAVGGSQSLVQTKVLDFLRSNEYAFFDRYQEGVNVRKVFLDSFSAEYYFSSANAITEEGEIYNIDGTGNRIACITYGPEHVFLIVSTKKIVKNLKEAALRVKNIAAPLNAKRLMLNTPCVKLGHCIKENIDSEQLMANGQPYCPQSICSFTQILSRQCIKNRIEVILVNEEFGY